MPPASLRTRQPFFTQPVQLKPSNGPGRPVHAATQQLVKSFRDAIKDAFSEARMSGLEADGGAAFLEAVEGLCADIRKMRETAPDALHYLETRLQHELDGHLFPPPIAAALRTITRLKVREVSYEAALRRDILKSIDSLKVQAQSGHRRTVAQGFFRLQLKVFESPRVTVTFKQSMLDEIEEALLELSDQFPGQFNTACDAISVARNAILLGAEITGVQTLLSAPVAAPGFARDIGVICIDLANRIRAEDVTFQSDLAQQLIGICCAEARDHSDPAIRELMQHLIATGISELPPGLDSGSGLVIHVEQADASRK